MIIDELFEGPQLCPECGGISFSDLILAEKKDACYYKVKASAKVWPSAYASGRLVQCRKKGAANYGKSKTESVAETGPFSYGKPPRKGSVADLAAKKRKEQERGQQPIEPKDQQVGVAKVKKGVSEQQELDEKWSQKYKKSINCANPKGFSQRAHCAGRKKNEDVAESYYDRDDYYSARMGGEYGKGMTASTYGSDGSDGPGRGDIHKGQTKHLSADPFGRSLGPVPQGARGRIYSTDEVDETRRGQVPMTLKPGETDNIEPENIAGFRQLPAYKQGQAAQQKAGKQLIQKSPYTFQSDQDWAYRQGATDAQRAAMFANFGGTKPLTTEGGDVFMPNIKDTAEYKAGLATGKLPVPYPEGTQQYASYYKGVIDRASPTLAKVGEEVEPTDDGAFSTWSGGMRVSGPNAYEKARQLDLDSFAEGEQQKGADYRDPKEVDYDNDYDAMVARVKKLAGLGPMKTVYDPKRRVYRNMPTAQQPKK